MDKNQFLSLIELNIKKEGFHITIVNSDTEPRYAYTIGLTNSLGFELVFAGGLFFLKDELNVIFHEIVKYIKKHGIQFKDNLIVPSSSYINFELAKVDESWSKMMLLGVFDYYKTKDVFALQIIPNSKFITLDVPVMKYTFDSKKQPIWQWIVKDWDLHIPKNSTVITNIDTLQGYLITEITRWEMDEWEMFSGNGSEVLKENIRIVSFATMLSIDRTIYQATDLEIGKGIWRETFESDWQKWEINNSN